MVINAFNFKVFVLTGCNIINFPIKPKLIVVTYVSVKDCVMHGRSGERWGIWKVTTELIKVFVANAMFEQGKIILKFRQRCLVDKINVFYSSVYLLTVSKK